MNKAQKQLLVETRKKLTQLMECLRTLLTPEELDTIAQVREALVEIEFVKPTRRSK
jgi:hypothetical protein